MAYVKQTWHDGEVITSAKLNYMENGIQEAGTTGGGSNLPEFTIADIDKCLKVTPVTDSVSEVFIPQQTISGSSWIEVPISNQSVFVVGANISATINGDTFTGVVEQPYSYPQCELLDSNGNASGFIIDIWDGTTELNPPTGGDYTISASVITTVVVGSEAGWDVPISYTKDDIRKSYEVVETFTPIEGAIIPEQGIHGGTSYTYTTMSFDSQEQYETVYDNFQHGNRINATINGFPYTTIIEGTDAYFENSFHIYKDTANSVIKFSPTPGGTSSNVYTVSAVIGTVGANAEFTDHEFMIQVAWGTSSYTDENDQEVYYDTVLSIDYPPEGITAQEIYQIIESGKDVYFRLVDSRRTRRYRIARVTAFDDSTPPSGTSSNVGCIFNDYGVTQGTIHGYRFATTPEYNSQTQEWDQTIIDVVFYYNYYGYGENPSGYFIVINNSWEGRSTGGGSEPIVI